MQRQLNLHFSGLELTLTGKKCLLLSLFEISSLIFSTLRLFKRKQNIVRIRKKNIYVRISKDKYDIIVNINQLCLFNPIAFIVLCIFI